MVYSLSDVTAKLLPKNGGDISNLTIGGKTVITSDGGKIDGILKLKSGGRIVSLDDETWKTVDIWSGNTSENSASLHLRTTDSPSDAGTFVLSSKDANGTVVDLYGKANGNLIWNGKHLVRSVNGSNADASGNVTIEVGSYPTKKTTFSLGSNSATDSSTVTKTVTGLTIGRPVYFVLKFPSVSFPSSAGTYSRAISLQLFSGVFSTASITNGVDFALYIPILGAEFTTYSDGSKESIVYEQCLTVFPCSTSISFGAIVKHAVTLEVWQ